MLAAAAAGQADPVESPASTSDALGFIGPERPNAEGGPTRVTIGLYVMAGGVRVLDVNEIWTPTPQVANERRLFKTFDEVVHVAPDGHVMYRQRFHGTITTPLDLRNFPLDRNTVSFRVVAAGYGPEEVEFVIDERITGQRHPLSLIDFRVADGTARLGTFEILPGGEEFSEFAYTLEVRRAQSYFIWKIIFPLATIVFMSWAAFWMDPSQQGSRVSVSITSVLTLIAYRFLLGAIVPRISYLTRLDIFILGATILVFLGLVEVVISGNLATRGSDRAGRRLDRGSRLFFPIAFAVIIAWAFWL
jgi:hypothetical protein